jgi:multiple sugar transport system permease protein
MKGRLEPRGQRVMKIALVVVVATWLTPILWLLLTSLKSEKQISSRTPEVIFSPTLDNFSRAWNDSDLPAAIVHTLVIAGSATIVTLIFATMLTYGVTRFRFRGRQQLVSWFLTLRMLPPIAVIVPLFVAYSNLDLVDTYRGVIFAYLPTTLPLGIWLLYGFMRFLPASLSEASTLDGATHWQTFRLVMLPTMVPAVAVAGTFCFLEVWNDFLISATLTGPRTNTVSISTLSFVTEHGTAYGPVSAAAIILVLPAFFVLLVLQRYLVQGLTLGAVR